MQKGWKTNLDLVSTITVLSYPLLFYKIAELVAEQNKTIKIPFGFHQTLNSYNFSGFLKMSMNNTRRTEDASFSSLLAVS